MNTTQETVESLEAAIVASNKRTNALKRELYELKTAETELVDKKAVRKADRAQRYATKNGLTIHNLRLAGNSVKVSHIRFTLIPGERTEFIDGVETKVPFVTLQPVPSYLRKTHTFYGKGGATYIVLTTPEGRVFAVSSHCHELDSFDYKLGVKLALDILNPSDVSVLIPADEVPELVG